MCRISSSLTSVAPVATTKSYNVTIQGPTRRRWRQRAALEPLRMNKTNRTNCSLRRNDILWFHWQFNYFMVVNFWPPAPPQYPCDCFTVQNEIIHESPPPPQVERTQGKIATLNGSVCAHAHSLIIILTIQSVCNGTLVCHPVGEILAVGRWRWRREGNQLRFYVSRETSKGNEP